MTRFLHTPCIRSGTIAAALLFTSGIAAHAQSVSAGALLDALSITVQADSSTVARGSMRFRQVRAANDVELVATGTVVRSGMRLTTDLRTDSAYQLRRYVAESRDSAGRIVDRIQVTSQGGRVTLERVTPTRRMVREFPAQRDLLVMDSAAISPFMVLAAQSLTPRRSMVVLDVRAGTVAAIPVSLGAAAVVTVADVSLSGVPVVLGSPTAFVTIWRDAKGRLLRIIWSGQRRVLRDDPPT